jgi:hypothetical protein
MSCKVLELIPYGCLSLSRFSLKNEYDLGEALTLNIIRMKWLIIVDYFYVERERESPCWRLAH